MINERISIGFNSTSKLALGSRLPDPESLKLLLLVDAAFQVNRLESLLN